MSSMKHKIPTQALGLTQDRFAQRLEIKRSLVGRMKQSKRTLVTQLVSFMRNFKELNILNSITLKLSA